MAESKHIMIVGAGLAGSLLACFLGRRGYRVSVHERRPDPRAAGFVGGRSINLALSTRGIHALEQINLAKRMFEAAIPMRGRMMHSISGELSFQRYSANEADAINSVSRGGLNLQLLEAADAYDNVSLHFAMRCEDVDLSAPAVTFIDEAGNASRVEADLVIGADGAFSAVRGAMQKTERFNYTQEYLQHGYKELHIPPTPGGDFALEPNALHIWPRGASMMIALPNADRSFTCTLFWPYHGPLGFDAVRTPAQILGHFKTHYPDAAPLMPTLVEDYQANPISSLVTIRCEPYHFENKVLLIGDAAHAVVPFYGQGMNAAFEDCAILDALIDKHQGDWETILREFSATRKRDADAIADLALENFIEMRDKVASKRFLLRKKLEHALHKLLPRTFLPLYDMISFSRIPYSQAKARAALQWRVLRVLMMCAAGAAALLLVIIIMLTAGLRT